MPRHPLLPILRVGFALSLGALLLYRTRRPPPEPLAAPVWASDIQEWPPGLLRAGEKATAPLPGQKRPPCAPRLEREVAGACWIPHAERPPCPDGTYEGQGMCLVPVRAAQRPSTSVRP